MDTKQNTSISMGLDAIFSANTPVEDKKKSFEVTPIFLSQICSSPFQARKHFSETAIAELASSIVENGLLQPIIVRQIENNQYELLAGERRLRALTLLNQKTIPAIICDVTNEMAMAFGLIENIQRENLNPIEESAAYDRLLNEFQLSHEELANRMGKSRSHMTNILRLHRLPDEIKQYVVNGQLSMGHARALLVLSIEEQIQIAKLIIEHELSVRQTEEYILNKNNKNEKKSAVISTELKQTISHWKNQLSNKYSADIKIAINAQGRARVTLEVTSPDELSLLIDRLV